MTDSLKVLEKLKEIAKDHLEELDVIMAIYIYADSNLDDVETILSQGYYRLLETEEDFEIYGERTLLDLGYKVIAMEE